MTQLLLDTHLLIWSAFDSVCLPPEVRDELEEPGTQLFFSAASIWEVAIKAARRRDDFLFDPSVLRSGLLQSGYSEVPISGPHAAAVAHIPRLHGDPFDRLLLAQARHEGFVLLTADRQLAAYGSPVRLVREA